MESIKLHYDVPGDDFTRAGAASGDVKRTLKQLGISPSVIRNVAVAMYEGEINMVIHAGGGEISVEIDEENITMTLSDHGPGIENVELATQLSKRAINPIKVLKMVGLGERMNNFPSQLSGGEQQRVSIARALAKNPKLLLCDEPTGALDYKTGKQILKILQEMCRKTGMTVIIITHNSAIAPMADKVISMRSGKIESYTINDDPVPAERIEW